MEAKIDNEFNSFVQCKATNEASHLVEAKIDNEFNSLYNVRLLMKQVILWKL